MLKTNNIEVKFSEIILVLKGISLEVPEGEARALLGANGAGKTTTLKAISGLLKSEEGEVTKGTIEFDGIRIENKEPEEIVRMGITQVMEGKQVFWYLTAEENLIAGAHTRHDGAGVKAALDLVFSYFPRLKEVRRLQAGFLSGGEQQMLVIGRALMTQPKILLLDEPSLGLGPLVMAEVFKIIGSLNRDLGVSILLVEQNASAALKISSYGYVMENGKIVLDGPSNVLRDNPDVREFYMGGGIGRKSYRDVKHYKRRKRWLV